MSDITARTATTHDVPRLLDWMVEFNRLEHIAWSRVTGETPLRKVIDDLALGCVGVLERDRAPIGYFVLTWGYDLEWDGRDAFLTELFLDASARGRGLGRACMERVEETARTHGVRALHLVVRHDNAAALRVYEERGFFAPPRLLMTKDLRDPQR